MNISKYVILLFIIALISNSCLKKSSPEAVILKQAESLVNQYPDSALSVLEPLLTNYSSKLSPNLSNRLTLVHIAAKDKCYQDITQDTLIFKAAKYYKETNDVLNVSKALFYSGRVHQERQNYKKAMLDYLEAEKYISNEKNNDGLKGLIISNIAHLLMEELEMDEAIIHYRKAINYFRAADDLKNETITYNQIGMNYLMKESSNDSASHYFQKGLELADKSKDYRLPFAYRNNLGLSWAEMGEFQKSASSLNEALEFAQNPSDSTKVYLNMAGMYYQKGSVDSVNYYIDKTESYLTKAPDYYLRKELNALQSNILKDKGKYNEAVLLSEDFIAYLEKEYNMQKDESILEIQKKYNYQLLNNEHNEALIYVQKWIIVLLVLVMIALSFGLIYYLKSIKNKRALNEAEERITALKTMAESYTHRNDSLKSALLKHFDVLKKVALIDSFLKKEDRESGTKILKKFNEILYGQEQLDWDVWYDTLNEIHNGLFETLRNNYPQLDNVDFKICCLIYAEFSNTEISILLALSTSAITSRRSSIRKKLKIEEYGNIAEFIREHIK